jgi:hypothetical protein
MRRGGWQRAGCGTQDGRKGVGGVGCGTRHAASARVVGAWVCMGWMRSWERIACKEYLQPEWVPARSFRRSRTLRRGGRAAGRTWPRLAWCAAARVFAGAQGRLCRYGTGRGAGEHVLEAAALPPPKRACSASQPRGGPTPPACEPQEHVHDVTALPPAQLLGAAAYNPIDSCDGIRMPVRHSCPHLHYTGGAGICSSARLIRSHSIRCCS